MTVTLLRAKLHRIRVTEACLDYVGSLTVDADLMDAADLYPHEKILCADVENGARFETYVIPGARGLRAAMERIMTDVMYEGAGDQGSRKVVVTAEMVKEGLN